MEHSIANWIVDYLLNSAWQVPLVLFAAFLAQTFLERLHTPAIVHRMWMGALAFAAILPAWRLTVWPGIALWRHAVPGAAGVVHVSIIPGVTTAAEGIRLSPVVLNTLLALYFATILYSISRIAWGLWKTGTLCRNASAPLLSHSMQQRWSELRTLMDVSQAILLSSSDVAGPAVVGMRTVLLPAGFIEKVQSHDLDAALSHELAHIRRADFVKNLGCAVLALPAAWHPCMWILRKMLAQSRETVCDAMAADALDGRRGYARSLLRLAMTIPAGFRGHVPAAVGIFEGNALERRVRIMMHSGKELKGAARIVAIAAALLLAIGAVVALPAARLAVRAADTTTARPQTITLPPQKSADRLTKQVMPVYPAKAKADHNTVNGSVVLGVLINTKGEPKHIHIVKSLRKDYDDSALTAVRQWRWKPVLLKGKPVEVKTDVTVTYSMDK